MNDDEHYSAHFTWMALRFHQANSHVLDQIDALEAGSGDRLSAPDREELNRVRLSLIALEQLVQRLSGDLDKVDFKYYQRKLEGRNLDSTEVEFWHSEEAVELGELIKKIDCDLGIEFQTRVAELGKRLGIF